MRPRWGSRRIGAAVCLPAAFASLLLGAWPSPARAVTHAELRAQIDRTSGRDPFGLVLVDGVVISGHFLGMLGDWGDSLASAERYETWRAAHPEGLPHQGERLTIALVSGDTLRAPFAGVGPAWLALGRPSSLVRDMVPFERIAAVRSEDGSLTSWEDLRPRLADAPTVIGVGLRRGEAQQVVPREAIRSVADAGTTEGTNMLPLVIIGGAVLAVVLCASTAKSAGSEAGNDFGSCTDSNKLTTRPFAGSVSGGLPAWPEGEARRP